jgi:serralysin
MKPLYDAAQLVTALTTKDGAEPSVAWSTEIITYSINTGQVDSTHAEYTTEMAGYVSMTAAMEAAAREAYELWDELIAVDLLEMDAWPSAHMTFNYSSNTGGATYANYQYWLVDNAPRSQYKLADADVWLNDTDPDQNDDGDLYLGGFAIETYLHEIGHSLGLTHPGDYNGTANYDLDATHAQDTQEYTVMSYFQAGADGSGTDHIGTAGRSYGATPLLHDILAIQTIYGADMTTRTGDTTYGFNSTAGHDAFDFTINTNPVIAIWDAGGTDKIDASGWGTDQVIDLNAGAFSSVGQMTRNVAIAFGATIERAVGGGGNDTLIGNAASNVFWGNAGNDTVSGGDGVDVVFGGAGADIIDGGNGEDFIRFASAASRVIVNLQDGIGTLGEAAGDTYVNIEHLSGSAFDDQLSGDAGHNQIFGGDGNDVIRGFGTNDFLLGEGGDDTIEGGTGNDVMRGGAGADILDGGSGSDWAQYLTAASAVSVDLSQGIGLTGEAAGDTFISIENLAGSAFADQLTGDDGRNIFLGGNGADTITGNGGNDMIRGEAGADILLGGLGDDTLVGGAGADQLDGGGGKDWADYADSSAAVDVSLTRGTGIGGDAQGDTLTAIEWLMGSAFDDVIEGDSGVNILRGGAGADRITGGGNEDYITGHGGADTFIFGLSHGIDRVFDFEIGVDFLEFQGDSIGFGDLSVNDFNGIASVSRGFGDTVLLFGVTPGEVVEDWFIFS